MQNVENKANRKVGDWPHRQQQLTIHKTENVLREALDLLDISFKNITVFANYTIYRLT